MSIEQSVFAALNTATIKAYPVEAPQNAVLPYVVYRRISTMRHDTIQGKGTIEQARIQLNCYGASYGAAKTLATSVHAAMSVHFGSKAVHLHESDETEDGKNWIWVDYSVWRQS